MTALYRTTEEEKEALAKKEKHHLTTIQSLENRLEACGPKKENNIKRRLEEARLNLAKIQEKKQALLVEADEAKKTK